MTKLLILKRSNRAGLDRESGLVCNGPGSTTGGNHGPSPIVRIARPRPGNRPQVDRGDREGPVRRYLGTPGTIEARSQPDRLRRADRNLSAGATARPFAARAG